MSDTIEKKCISKGVKLTEQRKVIAKVLSESKENKVRCTILIVMHVYI